MFGRMPFGVDPFSGASSAGPATCCNCSGGPIDPACGLCPSGLPATLYGTVSGSTCDQLPNGTVLTFRIINQAGEWSMIAGGPLDWSAFFSCIDLLCPGVGNAFCFNHECEGFSGQNELIPAGWTCSPVNFVKVITGFADECLDFTAGAECVATITITA